MPLCGIIKIVHTKKVIKYALISHFHNLPNLKELNVLNQIHIVTNGHHLSCNLALPVHKKTFDTGEWGRVGGIWQFQITEQ